MSACNSVRDLIIRQSLERMYQSLCQTRHCSTYDIISGFCISRMAIYRKTVFCDSYRYHHVFLLSGVICCLTDSSEILDHRLSTDIRLPSNMIVSLICATLSPFTLTPFTSA